MLLGFAEGIEADQQPLVMEALDHYLPRRQSLASHEYFCGEDRCRPLRRRAGVRLADLGHLRENLLSFSPSARKSKTTSIGLWISTLAPDLPAISPPDLAASRAADQRDRPAAAETLSPCRTLGDQSRGDAVPHWTRTRPWVRRRGSGAHG
jgi:hypothetical protein